MQRGQAHGRGAKLILFFDVSNGRTWEDFLGSRRHGRWETQQSISLKLKYLWNELHRMHIKKFSELNWYALKKL